MMGAFEAMGAIDNRQRAAVIGFSIGQQVVRTDPKGKGHMGAVTRISGEDVWVDFDNSGMGVPVRRDMLRPLRDEDIRPLLHGRSLDLAGAVRPSHTINPVLESRYLVKGWLDQGAFSVVYGESNVGKRFLAMDIAIHVAAGEDWHGHRISGGTGGQAR